MGIVCGYLNKPTSLLGDLPPQESEDMKNFWFILPFQRMENFKHINDAACRLLADSPIHCKTTKSTKAIPFMGLS